MLSRDDALASLEAAADNADAELVTELAGYREVTRARLWRGQVLVDWEPDPTAGGCLLRPALVRRLIALHAQVIQDEHVLRLIAPGRVVAGLSREHAELVARLGGARRVELDLRLRFDQSGAYRGGRETYLLIQRGQRAPLLDLVAEVRPRLSAGDAAQSASPRTSPAAP